MYVIWLQPVPSGPAVPSGAKRGKTCNRRHQAREKASELRHEWHWFCFWLVKTLIGQGTMYQNFEQFLPFFLEELSKETQITSPYDGLKYTHSELTIFRPNGCIAQGDSSIESEGASFLSRTKLNRDQVCTRSLRPVVMAADRFFLQISLISFPSSLEEKIKVNVNNNEKQRVWLYSNPLPVVEQCFNWPLKLTVKALSPPSLLTPSLISPPHKRPFLTKFLTSFSRLWAETRWVFFRNIHPSH